LKSRERIVCNSPKSCFRELFSLGNLSEDISTNKGGKNGKENRMSEAAGLTRVLDSWALLAFLEDEPAAEKVEDLIARANEAQGRLFISGINLGEIWYSLARSRSEQAADQAMVEITNLGVKRVDPDWPLNRVASSFKARFRLAYADCIAAALGKLHHCPVVTGDPEFKQLEKEIQVFWV